MRIAALLAALALFGCASAAPIAVQLDQKTGVCVNAAELGTFGSRVDFEGSQSQIGTYHGKGINFATENRAGNIGGIFKLHVDLTRKACQ